MPLCAVVPLSALVTVKTGVFTKPVVNFRKSTWMLVGVPATFFATVPCGIARKKRYSSSRV